MMDHFDEKLRQRAKQEPFQTPVSFQRRVEETCAALEEEPSTRPRRGHWRAWTAAAVVTLLVALPNVSGSAARAMEQVPVLGSLVRVITLRSYFYDDGHSSADISVPQVDGAGQAGEDVNRVVQANIHQLLDEFYADVDQIAQGGGYQGLSVSYDVVTDDEHWFTLRVNAIRTQGSSNEMLRYYHINKDTGQVATLSTLFPEHSDYVAELSREVRKQLDGQEYTNFIQESFCIDPEQSFYWGEEGSLILVFDEGTVAPASYGSPEVVISGAVVERLRDGG